MIITVGGIKGGSGKSTVATNLVVLRSLEGRDVLLVDADTQTTSSDFSLQRNNKTDGNAGFTCIKLAGQAVWSSPGLVDIPDTWVKGGCSHAEVPRTVSARRQMVELVRAGRTPGELAKEFEPSSESIRNWVRQAARDEGRGDGGLTTEEREELRRLRRECKQLRVERENPVKGSHFGSLGVTVGTIVRGTETSPAALRGSKCRDSSHWSSYGYSSEICRSEDMWGGRRKRPKPGGREVFEAARRVRVRGGVRADRRAGCREDNGIQVRGSEPRA